MSRVVVVGAGIVGLAVARTFALSGDEVIVIEKEADLARHQTGRNSGVIHSGLYYTPGSFKAKLCVAGAASMRSYAQEHGIAHEITGKLVVATHEDQLPQLAKLEERAIANGVPAHRVDRAGAREYEPEVECVAALRVESTGIIDYTGVCRAMAGEIVAAGGDIRYSTAFHSARTEAGSVVVTTDAGDLDADLFVNCAGLYSDVVARRSGVAPDVRIIPFRGEYFTLAPQAPTASAASSIRCPTRASRSSACT